MPFLLVAIGEEIAGDITENDLFEKDLPDVLMIVPESVLQSYSHEVKHKYLHALCV